MAAAGSPATRRWRSTASTGCRRSRRVPRARRRGVRRGHAQAARAVVTVPRSTSCARWRIGRLSARDDGARGGAGDPFRHSPRQGTERRRHVDRADHHFPRYLHRTRVRVGTLSEVAAQELIDDLVIAAAGALPAHAGGRAARRPDHRGHRRHGRRRAHVGDEDPFRCCRRSTNSGRRRS